MAVSVLQPVHPGYLDTDQPQLGARLGTKCDVELALVHYRRTAPGILHHRRQIEVILRDFFRYPVELLGSLSNIARELVSQEPLHHLNLQGITVIMALDVHIAADDRFMYVFYCFVRYQAKPLVVEDLKLVDSRARVAWSGIRERFTLPNLTISPGGSQQSETLDIDRKGMT